MVSWFSNASVVRLPAEFRGVELGFTAPVTEEGGGRVHMSDPDDGMFKNSGMPSCGAGLGRIRGGESSSVWHPLRSLSHVVDQGASTPSKE